MLRSQLLSEIFELLSLLLDLLTLLVFHELHLVDSLEDVGLPLLFSLKLADEELRPLERCLGSLCTSSGSLINSLEAHETKAKKVLATFQFSLAIESSILHELDVHDFTERGEEFEQILLCRLDAFGWVQRETSEVEIVTSHLLFELEGFETEESFSHCFLESRHNIQFLSPLLFFFFVFLRLTFSVLEMLESFSGIVRAVKTDKPEST